MALPTTTPVKKIKTAKMEFEEMPLLKGFDSGPETESVGFRVGDLREIIGVVEDD